MIERIIQWSTDNRVVVLLIFLLVTVAGVWGVLTTPIDVTKLVVK